MLGWHIKHCEDSLTAAVFSHLLHLPAELFWQVVSKACPEAGLPTGAIEPQCEFWPKWSPGGTDHTSYVEPDVFLRLAGCDVIIEAKRWDAAMHNKAQWERELAAYVNEFGHSHPVKLIALGSLERGKGSCLTHHIVTQRGGKPHEHVVSCQVFFCRWGDILTQCQHMARTPEIFHYPAPQAAAHRRILADVIHLFAAHGFSTGYWFDDFDFTPNRLASDLGRHLDTLAASSAALNSTANRHP